MKIAFVSLMRIAPWGGSEELWSKTALHALGEGHTVETLTYGWIPDSPRIVQLQQAGIITKFYHDDSRVLLDRIKVRLRLQTPKSELVPLLNADIIVISNGSIWDFLYFKNITNKIVALGKPYILLAHSAFDSSNNLNKADREYAMRFIANAAKRLFVSERNRESAERQLAAAISDYQVVNNPVSIQEPGIRPYPSSSKLLLACVGSLTCDSKGLDILLEALSSDVWRKRDFHLKFYGAGPDREYLEQLIHFYDLQGKVTLEGHVRNVNQIWETDQVLILPSVFEGVPMVVVEAMLMGRPVLATDVGGVERYVREGETGFMVQSAKAKYLAVGLQKLWDNRANLQQMGERAYHHAIAITDLHPLKSFLDIIEKAQYAALTK